MTADTTVDTGLKRRFEAGDGLRGLGVLCVLFAHAGKTTANLHPEPSFVSYFSETGHAIRSLPLAVYMFFALSGYLIARPFTHALVGGRELPSIRRYARSRLLRIVPALWVVWTITLLVDGTRDSSFGGILAVYGFAQTYHPSAVAWLLVQAWTLDVEMGFYIALPIAAWALYRLVSRLPPGRARALWLLVGIAMMAAVSMAVRIRWDNPAWRSTLPEFLVAFSPGIALAVIEPIWAPRALGSRAVRRAASVMMAVACVAFVARAFIPAGRPWEITAWGVPIGALLVAGGLVREWSGAPGFRAFTHPISTWWGERSYGVYLVHLLVLRHLAPIIHRFDSAWVAWAVVVVLLVPLSAAVAALSWHFVEQPAMRLGKRRGARPAAAPEPAAAPAQ